MEKKAQVLTVIAGRPAQIRAFETTHRTAKPFNLGLLIEIVGGITFAVVLLTLYGCNGDLERLQAQADWQAKVTRAALPQDGELVTIKRLSEKSYAVRHYRAGLKSTDILVMEDQ